MDNKEMIEILIKKLEEKEQGIESNLNTYNNLLNELTDAYDSLEEIDINDYEETYNILRKIADKYHINYFPSEITPNYIESVKNDINNRIYRVKLTIKKVRYQSIDVKSLRRLFNSETILNAPIDSTAKSNLLTKVIYSIKDFQLQNELLKQIMFSNYNVSKQKINSMKKQEPTKKLASKKNIIKDTGSKEYLKGITFDPKRLETLLVNIDSVLENNNYLIKNGYPTKVNEYFETIKDNPRHEYTLEDPKENLLLILKDMEYLKNASMDNETKFNYLTNTIENYTIAKELYSEIEEEQRSIKENEAKIIKLEHDHQEIFEKITSIIKNYDIESETLTIEEKNLLDSVLGFLKQNDFSAEDDTTSLSSAEALCSASPRLSVDFCKKYDIESKVKSYYEDYLSAETLEEKEFVYSFLESLIQELESVEVMKVEDELEAKTDNMIGKTSDNVIMLYLYDNDSKNTYMEDYIYNDSVTKSQIKLRDIEGINSLINRLKIDSGENRSFFHRKSEAVLDGSHHATPMRRIRTTNNRLLYQPISPLDLGLPNNYQVYAILTWGIKQSEYDIYNYVKTPRIQLPLNNLLISISSDIASIKSLKLSKQEEDKRISKYIQDLKANQEKIYQDYYDRMKCFINNGHKQARRGTR